MSIPKTITERFSRATRSKGDDYYFDGAVELWSDTGSEVRASVQGTILYSVAVDTADGVAGVSCSCPYFSVEGSLCKHIWATLLELDDAGFFDTDDAPVSIRMAPPLPPPALPENVVPIRPPLRPPQPPQWKQKLSALGGEVRSSREISPALDPDTRFEYVLRTRGLTRYAVEIGVMWSKPARLGKVRAKWLSLLVRDLASIPSPGDRELLTLIAQKHLHSYYSDEQKVDFRSAEIAPAMCHILLPRLCATGRFFVDDGSGGYAGPLAFEEQPWHFRGALRLDETQNRYRLEAWLERGAETMQLDEPLAFLPGRWLVTKAAISRVEGEGALPWISLLRRGELTVPLVDGEDFAAALMQRPHREPIELPDELKWVEITAAPRPHLRLRGDPSEGLVEARLSFEYGPTDVDAALGGDVVLGERKILRRDRTAENAAIRRLTEEGFARGRGTFPWSIPPMRFAGTISRLVSDGWRVEAEGKLYRTAGTMSIEVSSGVDWFELDGQADFEGATVKLPVLLAAARRGENTILLDDGTFGVIPDEWIRRYAPLALLGGGKGGELRFGKAQIGLVDALLAARPEVRFDETYRRARAKLLDFAGVRALDEPEQFHGQLRHYQKEGLGWFAFLREMGFGGCLADDMGLGKTIQVLALLASRTGGNKKPSLAVVPKSIVFNWKNEAERFTPALRILDFTGPGRGEGIEHFAEYDLVVTTYGTLRREAAKLAAVDFDYVILDEAQAIKNASTQSAKAVRVLKADHRLALSGTPIENHLGELWSLFEFLNPGFLGSAAAMKFLTGGTRVADEETRNFLARALRPFILRRTKEQVAPELPAKIEQTIFCELDRKQRKLYDELRTYYRATLKQKIDARGMGRAKIHVLEALLRLRQAACDPRLIGPVKGDAGSAKLEALLPQLEEVLEEGHKVLVFSQFTSFLALLREDLDKREIPYCYLDGKSRDREEQVERFQTDPAIGLFLISLKAGGLGLNLTAAEYVYLLDPWWNPAVEAQAIDRAHRIGQARQVFAYRLVSRDTVEEKILELQKSKKDLADAIVNADNSLIGKLTAEDLELLLG